MSALDAPFTLHDDRPRGGLLRAEFLRLRSRRFIRLLLGLAVLGWLAAVAIGLTQFGRPSPEDYAAARAAVQEQVSTQEGYRQACLADPTTTPEVCGPSLRAEDFRIEDFLPRTPFELSTAPVGAVAFGTVAAVLAFLIGATWIGAEWSSRNLVALLFWVPRRLSVMGTKLLVLALGAALIGIAAQAAWLAMAGLLQAVAGSDAALPAGFWGDLLATQGRCVLLVVLTALIGSGLATLVRNTGAALGVGFVYFAIAETALRILRPAWEPWLLSNNAFALVNPGGTAVYVPRGPLEPTRYVITNVQGGLVVAAVAAGVVAVGVLLFARRDLH